MSALSPSDDDTSPRADLRRAIRSVERERAGGLFCAFALAAALVFRDGHTFPTGPEALLVGVLVLLAFLYVQVCGLRIDAYKRDLGNLPSRGFP